MREKWLGLSYGVIQRSEGRNALLRSTYQAGGDARDAFGIVRYKKLPPGEHRGQWVLLPPQAPAWAHEPLRLWQALADAERQYDAQEGRFLDFQIPREIPEELYEALARYLYAPFVEDGLPVQVDVHVRMAADGGPNPHLHATIGGRPIGSDGYAKTKVCVRYWSRIFRNTGPSGIRCLVAERVNRFCEDNEIAVRVDPRTNEERGLPKPEPRLPRAVIRRPDTLAAKEQIALRDQHRADRTECDTADAQIEALTGFIEQQRVVIANKKAKLLRFMPEQKAEFSLEDRFAACASWARPLRAEIALLGDVISIKQGGHCALLLEEQEAVLEGRWPGRPDWVRSLFLALGWQRTRAVGPDPVRAQKWQDMIDLPIVPDLEPIPAPKGQVSIPSPPEEIRRPDPIECKTISETDLCSHDDDDEVDYSGFFRP